MMTENLFAQARAWVLEELTSLLPGLPEEILARIEVTPTKDSAHGDMASNAAMVAAKPAGKNPREIAAALAEKLSARPGIAKAEPAGPGFLNLTLESGLLLAQLPVILAAGEAYEMCIRDRAGYAGGILSAGVDGIKVAETVGLSLAAE